MNLGKRESERWAFCEFCRKTGNWIKAARFRAHVKRAHPKVTIPPMPNGDLPSWVKQKLKPKVTFRRVKPGKSGPKPKPKPSTTLIELSDDQKWYAMNPYSAGRFGSSRKH
jgi:hypothetical protein